MPVVSSVDYVAKRIYLSAETVNSTLDTLDVYKEVRALRRTTDLHQQFRPMIIAGGNIQKTATTFTVPYVQLLYGCRIVPYNTSHSLILIRDTFTDDNFSGSECFDRSPLSSTVAVDIDVNVQEVEVRTVSVGSAVLPSDIQAIIEGVWNALATDHTASNSMGANLTAARREAALAAALAASL